MKWDHWWEPTRKKSFLWYLLMIKVLGIPTPYQVFNYKMPPRFDLSIKELWKWYKE